MALERLSPLRVRRIHVRDRDLLVVRDVPRGAEDDLTSDAAGRGVIDVDLGV